uniref:uncharacterized protein LOC122599346 isoform X2 n=1 Tax=Erigeron canadensis TaxID=72917 RepID=UPI001CB931E9|nr:uncharacterized protein LOC122599346 isoform X2 [Erigeron canadensis]
MAKRSKRRQAQENKDRAGCMWGLISIFDFRHGRTTRRLLSDRRIVANNIVASELSMSEVNLLTSPEERHTEEVMQSENLNLDVKTSVKALMEEEMVSEQDSTQQTDGDQKISLSCQDSSQKTSEYGDLEALMKEIFLIYKNNGHSDLDERQNHSFSIFEEKMSAAIEVFMNEKPCDERSKDFIDTFQMLSSNKELFLKLLQDEASVNVNEEEKSPEKSNQSENEPTNPKPDVPITRKNRTFFRRRSKSQDSMPISRIVILKPNSLDNRFKMENDVHSESISSHFSFMEIKKRLKNAMGKEHQKRRGNEKTVFEGSNGWSSPNRDHFYTERFTKKIERVSKLKEFEVKQRESEENVDSGRHISHIYLEAKKHLSELISGGDEDADLMMENLPKTLGKILLFPDYSSLSPGASPRKEQAYGFTTAQTSLGPDGTFNSANEGQQCMASVDVEEKLKVSDEVSHDACVGGSPSSVMEDTSPQGVLDIAKPEEREAIEVLDYYCEPSSSLESIEDEQSGEIVKVSDQEKSFTGFIADLHEEDEFYSPLRSSFGNTNEEPGSTSNDKTGRPSPVSVLEPFFSDNEISPASTDYRPAEYGIQPLCIMFEDEDICSRNCMENEESAFEYVEAVLLASDLNWDEFEKRWLLSMQILDSSLFDELEIFSSYPSYDQRLLFDSTNEVLKEVCDCYLDVFLQLSFTKRKIQPIPKGVNLIHEVWERIELHLKNNYPLSLDHLVKKDLGISRTWMDLRTDSKALVFEIDESIFEDMIDDTLLSLVNSCFRVETYIS